MRFFTRNIPLVSPLVNIYMERYSIKHLCNDILSGIKIFILSFPEIIILTFACGERPGTGLVTVMCATAISCIIGNSKYNILCISYPICLLTTDIFLKYQYKGFFLIVFFASMNLILFSKIKLGEYLKYLSTSFLSAIYISVSINIIITQLQFMLGINGASMLNNIFFNLLFLYDNIGNITLLSIYYTIFFIGLLLILVFIFNGYLSFFIYSLICTIIMLCSKLNLIPIIQYINTQTIGEEYFNYMNKNNVLLLSYNLPSQSVLSNFIIYSLAISLILAMQISVFTTTESSITCSNKKNNNIEFITTGIANLISVSFGGLIVSPDPEYSMKSIQYCVKTIVPKIVLFCMLYFAFHLRDYIFPYIPVYAVSAMLILLSIHLLRNISVIKNSTINKSSKESYIFITTLITALLFGFISAVLIGFIFSLFDYIKRLINIKNPLVYSNKQHDRLIKEFISNKLRYLNTLNIPKSLLNEIEIIQLDNILNLNLLEKFRQMFASRGVFPKFIIMYFKNIPLLDGISLLQLQKFVKEVKNLKCTVITCGTNGMLLEVLQKKEKEINECNAFGYIIPDFQNVLSKILKISNMSNTNK